MRPRTFIAIIGLAIVLGAFAIGSYHPGVNDYGTTIECGSALSDTHYAAIDEDNMSYTRYGRDTSFADQCDQKTDTLMFGFIAVLIVGALTLLGAGLVRTPDPAGKK